MEYGGGDYSLTNTKGGKHTQRITIEGPPEDPTVVQETQGSEATTDDQQNHFENELLSMAMRCLRDDPILGGEVALQYLGKKLDIKIRVPDRNAPVPYPDLSCDLQEWLDEHPNEKDNYIRNLLDLEEPEVEPTLDERVVEGIKDKAVEAVVSSFGNRPSGWEDPVREFLSKNSLSDIIESVLNLRAKTGGAADDQNMSEAGDPQAEGTVNQAPITGFVPTGFGFN